MAWGCNINVAYREEDTEEASGLLEAMPLILEKHYSPRIWRWFTDDVNAKLQGCKWSPATGLINAEDEDINRAMDAFAEMEELQDSFVNMTMESLGEEGMHLFPLLPQN